MGQQSGIDPSTPWVWYDSQTDPTSTAPFVPGHDHDEFLVFRYFIGGSKHRVNVIPAQTITDLDFGNQFSIHGQKWHDVNGNGVFDNQFSPREPGLDGFTIQVVDQSNGQVVASQVSHAVDLDRDGHIADDERGLFWFNGLPLGNFEIAEVSQPGWVNSFSPAVVSVTPATVAQDVLIGNRSVGSIHGQKWNDLDGDGQKDANEPGLDGWTIELLDSTTGNLVASQVTQSVDVDQSGGIDPFTERGLYWFEDVTSTPGNLSCCLYTIREVQQLGWSQTFPPAPFQYENIPIQQGVPLSVSLDFGNKFRDADFGDAPAPYPTLTLDKGAAHGASGPTLGLLRDVDADGQPVGSLADGDDLNGTDDEDGVTIASVSGLSSIIEAGVQATATVTINNLPASGAVLDAWIDFNGDGSWDGANEQIVTNLTVNNVTTTVTFDVPPVVAKNLSSVTYSRFRVSSTGSSAPRGTVSDGEVEDDLLRVQFPLGGGALVPGVSLGNRKSAAVEVGDWDGDGNLDAFVVNTDSTPTNGNVLWIGNSVGSFSTSILVPVPSGSVGSDVALGDLNGDGLIDAWIANNGLNQIVINDGAGRFFLPSGSIVGDPATISTDVALGDVDGDGDLDAFVTNTGLANDPEENRIWLNDGNANFSLGQVMPGDASISVELGDLNRDGWLDAFVTNFDSLNEVWLNDGSGTFLPTAQPFTNVAGISTDVALGDLDGDSYLDAVVANYSFASGGLANQVWWNTGNGIFSAGPALGNSDSNAVSLGDVNGDGRLDVWVANADSTLGQHPNYVWLNGGSSFTQNAPLGGGSSFDVVLGDFDRDGHLDAFVANQSPNQIWFNQERVRCDLDLDATCDIADIDALVTEIVAGTHTPMFDMNGDALVTLEDVTDSPLGWLAVAGQQNLGPGLSYLQADANLDGFVDGVDFLTWNQHKFGKGGKWSFADWNADGTTDAADFVIWDSLRFSASAGLVQPVYSQGKDMKRQQNTTSNRGLLDTEHESFVGAVQFDVITQSGVVPSKTTVRSSPRRMFRSAQEATAVDAVLSGEFHEGELMFAFRQ